MWHHSNVQLSNKMALIGPDTRLSHADLREAATNRLSDLKAALPPTGERALVALPMARTVTHLVTLLALLASNHPVIVLPEEPEKSAEICRRYQPNVTVTVSGDDHVAVTHHSTAPTHDLHPDLALLLSTSGSTGSAKLVRLTKENLTSNAAAIAASLDLTNSDVAVTSLPLHYSYGLSVVFSHLSVGAAVSVVSESVTSESFWQRCQDDQVTSFAGVPFTFELLAKIGARQTHPLALPSLRRATVAGGKMPAAQVTTHAQLAKQHNWDFYVMYGATEATARMTCLPADLAIKHSDSVGYPIPGSSVSLRPLADQPEGTGELLFTGPGVMLGYAQAAADLSRGPDTAELARGELATGDIATIDDTGLVRIVGRLSSFVKIAGLRIDLNQVQQRLHRDGHDCAVTHLEEQLIIGLVGTAPDAADVTSTVATSLGVPRGAISTVPFVALPRTSSDKIDLPAIRARHIEQLESADRRTPIAASPLAQLQACFATHLGRVHVDRTDSFNRLGGDSLAYVAVSVEVEHIVGTLPPQWQRLSLAELAELASARPAPGRLRWWSTTVDATIVFRAVAMFMIVLSHAQLYEVAGSAHPLLAVAGLNLARFSTTVNTGWARTRAVLSNLGTLVWLTWPLILIGYLTNPEIRFANLTYTYVLTPWPGWTSASRNWFVEVLVLSVLLAAVLSALPVLRKLASPGFFWVWTAVVGLSLLFRFSAIGAGFTPNAGTMFFCVLWFFALGAALGHAHQWWQRALLSGVAIAGAWDFFPDQNRNLTIIVGLLLVIWVRTIRLPAVVVAVLQPIAAASLFIYVLHWEVLEPLRIAGHPWWGVGLSFVVGLSYAWVARKLGMTTASGSALWARWASRRVRLTRSREQKVPSQ